MINIKLRSVSLIFHSSHNIPLHYNWITITNIPFVSLPTELPAPPYGLEFTDIQRSSVAVSWSRPAYNGGAAVSGYEVEVREGDMGQWRPLASCGSHSLTHKVTGLTEGRDYYFRVTAANVAGQSKPAVSYRPVIPTKPLGESQ